MSETMYISIDKEELKKTSAAAEKEAIESIEDSNKLLWAKLPVSIETEIDGNEIFVNVESNLVYATLTIKLSDEDFIKLLEMAIKKMNKFKSLMESVK